MAKVPKIECDQQYTGAVICDESESVSSTENDVTSNQLQLVSNFAKACGFKGLMDYETEVSARTLKTNNALNRLNCYAKKIDQLFPVHEINLRRTNYLFTSETLAMNVLRSLLTFVGIGWTSRRTRDTIYISLVPEEHHERIMTIVKEQMSNESTKTESLTAREFEVSVADCLFPAYHKKTPDLLINNEYASWLLNDTKKLIFLGIFRDGFPLKNANLYGHKYAIAVGGNKIYENTLKPDVNIYATKCVPWRQLTVMKLEIHIDTKDLWIPSNAVLRFSLKPYVSNIHVSTNRGGWHLDSNITSVNWQTKYDTPTYLRFYHGMCALTKCWDDDVPFKESRNFSRSTVNGLEIGHLDFSTEPWNESNKVVGHTTDGNFLFINKGLLHLVYCKPTLDVVLESGCTKFMVDKEGITHSRPLHDYISGADTISDFKLKKLDGKLTGNPIIEIAFKGEFGQTKIFTMKDSLTVDENTVKFEEFKAPTSVISIICGTSQRCSVLMTVKDLLPGTYLLEYTRGLLCHGIRAKAARELDITVNLAELMQKLKAEEEEQQKNRNNLHFDGIIADTTTDFPYFHEIAPRNKLSLHTDTPAIVSPWNPTSIQPDLQYKVPSLIATMLH